MVHLVLEAAAVDNSQSIYSLMAIIDDINADLLQAQKNKDELAILTLRGLKNTLQNAEIGNDRKALTDEQVLKLLQTEVKRRRESIELFVKGGRQELADKEQSEIDLIQKYLPAALDEAEVKAIVDQTIDELGITDPSQMGQVIGAVMPKVAGRADGGLVSRLVKERLAQ